MVAPEAPAEDAEEGEGEVADGDVGADAPLGPVEDRADGEGALEDAEAVLDAPQPGVMGPDGGGRVGEAGENGVEAVEEGARGDGLVVEGDRALPDREEASGASLAPDPFGEALPRLGDRPLPVPGVLPRLLRAVAQISRRPR